MLAQLEKTYGATDVNMPFEERIMEIADRIAQDYYEELLPELSYVKEGSFLDDLDELNLGIRLRERWLPVFPLPCYPDAVPIWICGKMT